MSRFANVPKPSFAHRPVPGETTAPLSRVARGITRRTAMLAEASAVLTCIPEPGEALHALITGRYDLMHLLVVLLGKIGPAKSIRIATLSYNARNLAEMLTVLDGTDSPCLTLLCSCFFRDHNKELWEETLEEFRDRGQRAAAARTHAKVITIETATGAKYALEGSANLRSNANREQVCLVHDSELHDWHATWIDEFVSKHEPEVDAHGQSESG